MSKRVNEISWEKLHLDLLEDGITPRHPNFHGIAEDYISRLFGISPNSPEAVLEQVSLEMDKYCAEVERKWKLNAHYDKRCLNKNIGKQV